MKGNVPKTAYWRWMVAQGNKQREIAERPHQHRFDGADRCIVCHKHMDDLPEVWE